MNSNVLAGVLAVALIGLLVGGVVVYSNLSTKIATVEIELRNTEKERSDLSAKLEEKENELVAARQRADVGHEELAKERERIQRLHAGIGVIGHCLNGVLQSLSATSDGDQAQALLVLLTVVDSCKASEKIIEEVQAFQTSGGNATPPSGGSRTAYN
jgi:hypothetical protein